MLEPPTKRVLRSLALLTVLAVGCGDAGPQGAMGEQGPPGAMGETGPQGEPGTANVFYSEWFSLDEATDKNGVTIMSGAYSEPRMIGF